MQATSNEEQRKVENEDVDLMRHQPNNLLDLTVTNAPCMSSEGNNTVPLPSMEDPIIEVPHIRFILGDRPLILEDYVQLPLIKK